MKYTITPLNVLMLIFLIYIFYDYSTFWGVHGDGLVGTGLLIGIPLALVVLLVDLAIQNFVGTYKWRLIIEIILASALVLCYIWMRYNWG